MTAAELYECDPGFRGFLTVWDRDRRCPFALQDYLLERGMDSQADCARWCATEPDRDLFKMAQYPGTVRAKCGPYPVRGIFRKGFGWSSYANMADVIFCHGVPELRLNEYVVALDKPSTTSAIIALLDAWIPESVPCHLPTSTS